MASKKIKKIDSEKARMKRVIGVLKQTFPDAKCSLEYRTPFELLCATVLSAQCTDERVNRTTPGLFARFPTPEKMAQAPLSEIEKIVKPTGFYKNKAKSLSELSKVISKKYLGEVPSRMEDLITLRGVGRKTANVVLSHAFGIPSGVVVDTHVGRITRRMGFTSLKDPEKVERVLMDLVPQVDWTLFSHLLISLGRGVCSARTRPKCEVCPLESICLKKIS